MFLTEEVTEYLHQLHGYLQVQYSRMEEMQKLIEQLQQDVKQLEEKSKNPPVVRNEYKFDLLKVERLEGTLNIGINPNGSESTIGEFAVNQAMDGPSDTQPDPAIVERIKAHIEEYLTNEACEVLLCMEQSYRYPMSEDYRNFILEDIKKQIDKRILHYLKQYNTEQMEPEQSAEVEKRILQYIQQDIEETLDAFVRNLPRTENGAK